MTILKEVYDEGPLSLFYPDMLMREFFLISEKDISIGKTVVRYKNGKSRCRVMDIDDTGNYILWDGGGTSLSIKRIGLSDLIKDWVVVKFLVKDLQYKGREIRSIEDVQPNYSFDDNGYNYSTAYKYIKNKETGVICRYECRSVKETIWNGPGDISMIYNDYSHVIIEHPVDYEVCLKDDYVVDKWEIINPIFMDYDFKKNV